MAEKKISNKQKQDERLRDDIASFKASVAFLLFCAALFFTATNLQYNRTSLHVPIRVFLGENPWFMAIFFVLAGVCCFWKYKNVKSGKDESYSYFASDDALGLSLFLLVFAISFAITYSLPVLISVIVGCALIYYVKHFFAKDFYIVTLLNLDIAAALFLVFGSTGTTGALATFAKAVAVIAIAAVFVYVVLEALKNRRAKSQLVPTVISLVTGIVLAVVLFALPATFTVLIAEIILLVQYVALGVYYTVRLLNQ